MATKKISKKARLAQQPTRAVLWELIRDLLYDVCRYDRNPDVFREAWPENYIFLTKILDFHTDYSMRVCLKAAKKYSQDKHRSALTDIVRQIRDGKLSLTEQEINLEKWLEQSYKDGFGKTKRKKALETLMSGLTVEKILEIGGPEQMVELKMGLLENLSDKTIADNKRRLRKRDKALGEVAYEELLFIQRILCLNPTAAQRVLKICEQAWEREEFAEPLPDGEQWLGREWRKN